MQVLNLPSYEYKIKKSDGKSLIFDPIRKKYLVLTPEEWVRQHVIHLLVEHLAYARSLLRIEGGLVYHTMDKRSDILVYDKEGNPYLLIECKAPKVALNHKTISQAAIYNKTYKAPFVAICNGLKTYCFEMDFENNSSKQMKTLPEAP